MTILRITISGSTYRNLNPYEVLQVDPDASLDDVKKKYRRLSILVHPDKNQVLNANFENSILWSVYFGV